MEKIPYLGHSLYCWKCGESTFLAYPEMGARLMNWNIRLGDGSIRDVIYWPEIKSMDEFPKVRGGNPILFPFAGRSFDQGAINHWKSADGVQRPMPMHGIARQSKFSITRLDGHGFAAQLMPGDDAKASYPYDYEFEVTYRFEPLGLACEFTLRNLDKHPIPWSAGHHFYFTLPWSEGASRDDYLIRIPAGKTYVQDMEKTGQLKPGPVLKLDEPLSNPALIDVLHCALKSNTVVFGEKSRPGDIHVKIGAAKVPPADTTVVTWTPDKDAPFFCVEPWMGPPNAIEHKHGLYWVPPGHTQSFTVEIALK
ncbi:MAG: aldose epimerase [Opitutaceae bacterium]|jgi:galactose mutarotase-like enzyme